MRFMDYFILIIFIHFFFFNENWIIRKGFRKIWATGWFVNLKYNTCKKLSIYIYMRNTEHGKYLEKKNVVYKNKNTVYLY